MNRNDYYSDSDPKDGCFGVVLVVMAIILVCMAVMCSCKSAEPETIVSVVYQHDTLTLVQQQRDSIYLHDSVSVDRYMSGDTLYVTQERWHTKYIDRLKHDSIYISKTDTLRQTERVEVEKRLNWWQKTTGWIGTVALIGGVAALVLWLWCKLKR